MKRIKTHKLALRPETIRALASGALDRIDGAAINTGNTMQVCVDTDLATNCLCGGYTNGCQPNTIGCDVPTRVAC